MEVTGHPTPFIMKEKFLSLSIKTTGLSSVNNCIHTIGCVVYYDNQVQEIATFTMSPISDRIVEPEAIQLSGLTEEDILKYGKPHVVAREFINFLGRHVDLEDDKDKMFVLIYESDFSTGFFMDWLKHSSVMSYGYQNLHLNIISVKSKVVDAIRPVILKFKSFRIDVISKVFGIEVKRHDVESEALATQLLFNHVDLATTIDYDEL